MKHWCTEADDPQRLLYDARISYQRYVYEIKSSLETSINLIKMPHFAGHPVRQHHLTPLPPPLDADYPSDSQILINRWAELAAGLGCVSVIAVSRVHSSEH
jgi:hypothetical protein